MAALSSDNLLDIAKYLGTQDLYIVASVCRAWRDFIFSSPQLWQHPHLSIVQTGYRGPVSFRPRPSALREHLGTLPVRSILVTAVLDIYAGALHKGLVPFLGTTPAPPLHLLLQGLKGHDSLEFLRAIKQIRKVNRLTLGMRLEMDHLAFVMIWLSTAGSGVPGTVDLVCATDSSLEPLRNIGALTGQSSKDSKSEGLHTLNIRVPEEAVDRWRNSTALSLLPCKSVESVHVEGGLWCLNASVKSQGTITSLTMQNLHKFECRSESIRLDALRSVHLSLNSDSKTKWGDIARFLRTSIGNALETLEIHFLPASREGHDHRIVNDAWECGMIHALNLREITLVSYIPRTLSCLCDNPHVSDKLEKLVLGNNVLPRDFVRTFTPERLPSLRILDNSDTSFHLYTPVKEQQAWVKAWRARSTEIFKPAEALEGRFEAVNEV